MKQSKLEKIVECEKSNDNITIVHLQRKYYLNYFKAREVFDKIKQLKYKGYNVPDVGEFVSESTAEDDIMLDYCQAVKACTDCDKCLFANKYTTDTGNVDVILEWHEARVKEVK